MIERGLVSDVTGDYRIIDITHISEMMKSDHYEYVGYRRVNDIVWHYFEYKEKDE